MSKYEYINRKVIAATADFLQDYREHHPETRTPMRDAMKYAGTNERSRFVRAAKQLKWNVVVSRGHVYENGVMLW